MPEKKKSKSLKNSSKSKKIKDNVKKL